MGIKVGAGAMAIIFFFVLVGPQLWEYFVDNNGLPTPATYATTSSTITPEAKICQDPVNPYDENINEGHYAGFEWEAENGGNCDTGGDSFNEGCSEYVRQLLEYNTCESNK